AMARRVLRSLSCICGRARAGARRAHCSSRCHDRVRGTAHRSASRRHAGAHCRDRGHSGDPRGDQGDDEREAWLHRAPRGYRGLRQRDHPAAVERLRATEIIGATEMVEEELLAEARTLLDLCRAKKLTIATAESCTGGLVAATLTEIPGSSDVVERGFITYSNAAKTAMVGVPADVIARF